MKLLEENPEQCVSNVFLEIILEDMTKIQTTKAKLDQWGHMNIRNFCSANNKTETGTSMPLYL